MPLSSIAEIRRATKPTFAKKIIRGIKRRTFKDAPINLYTKLLPSKGREIWCGPAVPHVPLYAIYKIAAKLGLKFSPERTRHTVGALSWCDDTFCEALQRDGYRTINGANTDISKHFVEREFAKAFGYDLAIDPLAFEGMAIKKSNKNAVFKHEAAVLRCPIAVMDPSYSYELLIDASIDGQFFEELRIPIIGDEIPLVYVKVNPIEHRFDNWIITCGLVRDVSVLLSTDEVRNCLALGRGMGIDYAEFDALRDKRSGKLYVIDVNKTPAGPPLPLNLFDKIAAVNILAESFERSFIKS